MKAFWIGKLNLGRKIQNWVFKKSIGIFQGFIKFIKALIGRKIGFWVQFRLLFEEIKVWGLIEILKS
jgi:hypothetical protein